MEPIEVIRDRDLPDVEANKIMKDMKKRGYKLSQTSVTDKVKFTFQKEL